jgi:PII-like signaling protein
MNLPEEAELLRIFIGESDRYEGKPLFEAIVEEARRQSLGGATVFRGLMGYGAHSRVHTSKVLRLSEDLPIVIEIVDATEKIEAFLPDLDRMMQEGLVTVERAKVLVYRPGKADKA